MALIPVVTEDDNIVGHKERASIGTEDIYRVSALWITNSVGQILMAQRSFSKAKSPGAWGPAVAGTVEKGESYTGNIIKETREELGITITPENITIGPKTRVRTDRSNYFTQWFFLEKDDALDVARIEPVEVAQIAWYGKDELLIALTEHPEQFTPAAPQWIPLLCSRQDSNLE